MKNLKKLYNEKLKYNCSFTTCINKNDVLLVVFLGCNDFVITSNYWGVVAIGQRHWNNETEQAEYQYIKKCFSVSVCSIEFILTKYERKRLETKSKIIFERIKDNEKEQHFIY